MSEYKNPPVKEVLCEVQFEAGEQWDIAQPGLIYDKLRESFPKRKQIQNVAIKFDLAQPPTITKTPRIQFLREDERVLVQIGENLLAVNHLPRYDGWPAFQPIVEKAFHAYREVAAPKSIVRIGLRYINHIFIPEQKEFHLERYFQVFPKFPDSLGSIGEIDMNLILPGASTSDGLRLHLATVPAEKGAMFLLDFDHFTRGDKMIPCETLLPWLESAHAKVYETFEMALTQDTKSLFL